MFRTAGAIAFGRGTSATLSDTVARFGRRVVLVTGARSLGKSGALYLIRERLASAGIEVVTLTVSGEPDVDTVDRGAAKARDCGAEVIAAVGGGSVLDAAKAIAVVATNGGSARDYLEDLPTGGGRAIHEAPLPLIAMPTTAGTGSEVTRNAVLRVPEMAIKRSMRDDRMLPRVAIVDADLVATAPGVAVPAALDALTHLIESYVSLGAQPTTDLVAFEGACRAVSALKLLAGGRATPDVWQDLSLVSLWGGLALANAGLGAVHGLVAPLGGRCGIAHGAACAALLSPTIRANVQALRARGRDAPGLVRYGALAEALSASDDPMRLADDIDSLRRRLGARSLAQLGARRADVSEIVATARGGSMKYNPIVLTDKELESVLLLGLDETAGGAA